MASRSAASAAPALSSHIRHESYTVEIFAASLPDVEGFMLKRESAVVPRKYPGLKGRIAMHDIEKEVNPE